jgi:hypothetical protein
MLTVGPPPDAPPRLPHEPDVGILVVRRALTELYFPREPAIVVPRGGKTQLFDLAAERIGNGPMTYLEFGVHEGWSMGEIVGRFSHPGARFCGFDSFEGLPESWGGFLPGRFSTGGITPSSRDPRVSFVKGWFQNTLPGFLATHPIAQPVLINFDADIYSSTLFVLASLRSYVSEYWFIFDEFNWDESVALYDYVRAFPVELEFIACTKDENGAPIQLLGRLRNTIYEPPFGV